MEDENHEKREENISRVDNDNSNINSENKPEEKVEEKTEEQKPVVSMGASPSHTPTPKVKSEQQLTKKMRENPWLLSTLVLGAIVIVLLFLGNFSGGVTGNVVGEDVVGDNLITYLNTIAEEPVTLIDVEDDGNMYLVTVEYQGEELPIYVTKDGEYYTPSLLPITEGGKNAPSTSAEVVEVPKSDNPVGELFVWSYCPYGVQGQGPLAEVANLLGNNVDLKIVPYYDGHGEYETQQNKIQLCVQKLAPEKYWDYAAGFVSDIYPVCGQAGDIECDKTSSVTLMDSLGIDSDAVLACVETEGDTLFSEASARASELGVQGSPTLAINGVIIQPASRTADAYKDAVCQGFNTVPEECFTALDSTAAAAAGSC